MNLLHEPGVIIVQQGASDNHVLRIWGIPRLRPHYTTRLFTTLRSRIGAVIT